MSQIKENLSVLQAKIKKGTIREVKLVAVTKTVPAERIKEALEAGVTAVGENRVQEARQKFDLLAGASVEKHLIGHLQTNKVKMAVKLFDWIESVDSLRLAEMLEREAEVLGKKLVCLLEINIAGEQSKSGVRPDQAQELLRQALGFKYLSFTGLMTVAPLTGNPESARPYFRQMRELKEKIERNLGLSLPYLSMGMTDDFEAALAEGANVIRIGRGIFGGRV